MRRLALLIATLTLTACATAPRHADVPPTVPPPLPPFPIQILAFNDFHGNLETPPPVEFTEADGSKVKVTTGGAAHLAAMLEKLRATNPYTVTVSAGDTIGATPLTSALFLDEPTIETMNRLKLEFNAVGNHEFDKGVLELKRMQQGGCIQHTRRMPCAVEPFQGSKFRYLAANVIQPDGTTVFPSSGIKQFDTPVGTIRIGFIGMTLKDTKNLVTPGGVAGLTFADEAATANALVPKLKAEGANAIVLLIHQGGKLPTFNRGNGCDGFYGEIKPIVEQLDPAITTVVSGHTHWAYVCQNGAVDTKPGQLLTSAGKFGYMVTEIRLGFDPKTKALVDQSAVNDIVGDGQNGEDAAVKAYVDKYVAAAAPLANRLVGRLTTVAKRSEYDGESPAADLIADSMLAATRDKAKGGAQIALVNATGVRVDLPGGEVLYKDAFKMMPFGNNLVVMTLTGADLKEAVEQQFAIPVREGFNDPSVLAPSMGFGYTFDLSRPQGSRIVGMTLNGKPIDPKASYRVVVNNYLASGGDSIKAFTKGRDITDAGIIDIDALIAWIAGGRTPPKADRITRAF
ncbi:bifunctional metallophosphatase/5'-nucleotidase [Sphingomonas jaspsi]|uniref:bifunctional metallophosphatase/5'-nucleotidase n=1 Tax=Sphingomonas jaspsi TaxID=392409 RepID=UPI0004B377CB|nr:bifunctional metallophosphatase/5'-nucleotidase [Sphingomonas jaspsi]